VIHLKKKTNGGIMTLAAKIEEDMRNAMKSGDSERAGTLKMLKSDLMYEKAKTGIELNDDQILECNKKGSQKEKRPSRNMKMQAERPCR
jgi:uncharacterized protein YqeY